MKKLFEHLDRTIAEYNCQESAGAFVVFGELMKIRLYLNKFNEAVFIHRGIAEKLLDVINTEIANCVDDPRLREPPEYLKNLKAALEEAIK
jgi:hypothetical protein